MDLSQLIGTCSAAHTEAGITYELSEADLLPGMISSTVSRRTQITIHMLRSDYREQRNSYYNKCGWYERIAVII